MHLPWHEVGEAILAEENEDPRALVGSDAPGMRAHGPGSGFGPCAPAVPGGAGDAERIARGLHAERAVMGIHERHARLPSPDVVSSRSISSIISAILF